MGELPPNFQRGEPPWNEGRGGRMPDDRTPNFGGGPIGAPPPPQWAKAYPRGPGRGPSTWPAIAASGIAAAVAVTALIVAVVALMRPTTSAASSTMPTYAPADVSTAQKKLCDTYDLAARSVRIETNGTDKAIARIALLNSASMLDSASVEPALDAEHRDAAHALATAYRAANALASVSTDEQYRSAVDDINAKDAAMKKVCGGS